MKRRVRLEDWDGRLYRWIDDINKTDFEWGQFDCVSGLALGAVREQTGADLSSLVPDYGTEKAALRLIVEAGGPIKLMSKYLKRSRKRHRGNIVLINTFTHPSYGIRMGTHVACLCDGEGIKMVRAPRNAPEWSVVN